MSVPRRVSAYLDLADQDTDAAPTLAQSANRYAAYHCQQAVEKLAKAVLLSLSIESGTEHRIDVLVGRIPDDNPWKLRLRPLDVYSPYATAYRYPTPGGRIAAAPQPERTLGDAMPIRSLVRMAREELR